MSHKKLLDASLCGLLLEIDQDLMRAVLERGCSCGGRLHRSNYMRKPRGAGWPSDPSYSVRYSACCDQEGCRQRATSSSVRFLGRRVFLGVLVVLVSALRQGPTPTRMRVLTDEFGVDRRTVERWQRWWRDEFKGSRCWRLVRARLVEVGEVMPGSIMEHLKELGERERLIAAMRLLAGVGRSAGLPDPTL